MISLLLPLSEILFLLLCASSHECLSMAQNAPAQSWSFKAIPSDIRYLVPQHLLNSAYFKNSIKNLIYYSRVEKTLHEDIATLNGNNSFKVTFQHFINNISRYEKKSLIKFLAKAPQDTILRALINNISFESTWDGPCLLSHLPTEIRKEIFAHILESQFPIESIVQFIRLRETCHLLHQDIDALIKPHNRQDDTEMFVMELELTPFEKLFGVFVKSIPEEKQPEMLTLLNKFATVNTKIKQPLPSILYKIIIRTNCRRYLCNNPTKATSERKAQSADELLNYVIPTNPCRTDRRDSDSDHLYSQAYLEQACDISKQAKKSYI